MVAELMLIGMPNDRIHATLMLKYPAMVWKMQVILPQNNEPGHQARISR